MLTINWQLILKINSHKPAFLNNNRERTARLDGFTDMVIDKIVLAEKNDKLPHNLKPTDIKKLFSAILDKMVLTRTSLLNKKMLALELENKKIIALLAEEKAINHHQTEFISHTSHDLRSPLTSIQLSAALIERYYKRLDKERLFAHLDQIRKSVNDLTGMLNELAECSNPVKAD